MIMLVSLNSNTTGVTSGADTSNPSGAPEFTPGFYFSWLRVAPSLVFCVVFCISLFVLLCVFFWPLRCLSFDLLFLNNPLVS